ncbi:MAG: hypothetical protein Ct9H90mP16_16420 [Candidatus Poseidoniales archaeon]|nr:MAG: hypothetical protein Ct9H90mP16_16420 [Candidatus Poseidoniales archaeon]
MQSWAEEVGDTESEVWAAVLAGPSLVIIDSSLMPLPEGAVNPPPTLNLTIGSPILISDPTNLGVNRTVYVAGILKQESSIMLSGIYIQSDFAAERFDAKPQIVWFSMPNGTSVSAQEQAAERLNGG